MISEKHRHIFTPIISMDNIYRLNESLWFQFIEQGKPIGQSVIIVLALFIGGQADMSSISRFVIDAPIKKIEPIC